MTDNTDLIARLRQATTWGYMPRRARFLFEEAANALANVTPPNTSPPPVNETTEIEQVERV